MKNTKIFGLVIMLIFLLSSIAYAGPEEICNFQGTVSKSDGTKLDGSSVTAHNSGGELLETAVQGVEFGKYLINVFKKDLPVNFKAGGVPTEEGEISDCGENPNWLDLTIDAGVVDNDGDGHYALGSGGDDCDDNSASIYPGATEICGDGVDQDCDGSDLACPSGGGGGGGGGYTGSPACSPDWHCTHWSECQPNGYRTRSCTDHNECNEEQNKPAEEEKCTYESAGEEELGGVEEENLPPSEEGESEPEVEPEDLQGITGTVVFDTLGKASNIAWLVLLGLLLIVLIAIITSTRRNKSLVEIK